MPSVLAVVMEGRNRDSVRNLLAVKLPPDVYPRVTDEQVDWLLVNEFDTAAMLHNVKAEDFANSPFSGALRRQMAVAFSAPGLFQSAAICV